MSYILHIETSGHNCSVAIGNKGQLIAQKIDVVGLQHAEVLHVLIAELLIDCQLHFSDLNAVAISEGPGSYTGLRIGASAAKGFCYALGIPLISINTLAIYYQTLLENKQLTLDDNLIASIDARRDEIYFAAFKNAKLVIATQAKVLNDSFTELFHQKENYFVCGSGAQKTYDHLKDKITVKILELESIASQYMISLAWQKFNNQHFEDTAYFEPNYVKPFFTTAKI
jgi:tRNA threonylcarbamoyladenosine biosynthesis protein TsaB